MERRKSTGLTPTVQGTWKGRAADEALYFYQFVEEISVLDEIEEKEIVLTGYTCDEGVRRNKGRVGASNGPAVIKAMLARTAFHAKVYDLGNIVCENGRMEDCQSLLSAITAVAVERRAFPINVGGGHDIAYGTGRGVIDAISKEGSTLGIVNIDAHFDLRIPSPKATSGTPFYQLAKYCETSGIEFDYLVLGIQRQSNTSDLFRTADLLNTHYLMDEDCSVENIGEALTRIATKVDYIYLSIDLDAISAAYAPGVSAANPVGLRPDLILKAIRKVFNTRKVIAVDIAEMNPKYDIDQRTAKVAAYLINEICHLYVSCRNES